MSSSLLLPAQTLLTEQFVQTPLTEVFQVFEQKYGLALAYEEAAVAGQSVTLSLERTPVVTALFQVLESAGMEYLTLEEHQILIRRRPTAAPAEPANGLWLSGIIRDERSGQPLPYASVQWAGHTLGSSADMEGRFRLWLPVADTTVELQLRHIGYQSRRMSCQAHDGLFLELSLTPTSLAVEEILVVSTFPALSTDLGAQAYRMRPGQSLPGLGSQRDPLRQMQLLPGLSAYNDYSATPQVRGGLPDENLLVWDGMVLYNIDHFFGIFSAVQGDLVEEVNLYKNSFPAEYGGRTSSIVEIASPKTQPEQPTGSATLTNISLSGKVDLPLGPKMSLLAGGRMTHSTLGQSDMFRSFRQQIRLPDLSDGQAASSQVARIRPDFRFYDGFAKWRWAISERTQMEVNAFTSQDAYEYDYRFAFRQLWDRLIIVNENAASEQARWGNQAASWVLSHRWNEQWSTQLTAGISRYEQEELTQTELLRYRQRGGDTASFSTRNEHFNNLQGVHANWKHEWRPKDGHAYTFGYRFEHNATELSLLNDTDRLLEQDAGAAQHGLYAGGAYESADWQWAWAGHATYYGGTGQLYFSPRLRAGYRLGEHWGLQASVSRYHQFLRRYYHENRFGRSLAVWALAGDGALPVAHANQFTLGLTRQGQSFSLSAELFYKQTAGSLQHASLFGGLGNANDPRPQNREFRIFQGEGKAYGLELLLRKPGERYSGWLAYSLSRSWQRYPQAFRNAWFPTQEDRPHQLKLYNEYAWKRWAVSATYVFASGAPYFDAARAGFLADRGQAQPDYYARIQDYHRLDWSAIYRFAWKGADIELNASVFNLLDASNALYRQQFYGFSLLENQPLRRTAILGNELELLGRTLSVGLTINW